MATVVETPVIGEQRILISGISYEFYKLFCEEIGEQPVRLSFNDESLEIMITKRPHEHFKKLLSMLIEATLLELDMPMYPGGMMTFQRDDLKKGFEPDDCWWIANSAQVSDSTDYDSKSDPPPDLAIEVEITHSLLRRISIYAAIGVPEVWRFDGKRLRFCVLNKQGNYDDAESSKAFPFLRPADLLPYLLADNAGNATSRVKSYLEWLRGREA